MQKENIQRKILFLEIIENLFYCKNNPVFLQLACTGHNPQPHSTPSHCQPGPTSWSPVWYFATCPSHTDIQTAPGSYCSCVCAEPFSKSTPLFPSYSSWSIASDQTERHKLLKKHVTSSEIGKSSKNEHLFYYYSF